MNQLHYHEGTINRKGEIPMRICIPVADNSGLDSQLYDHFGSAPCFALVDTESGAVEVVQNTGHHRERGRCRPIAHVDVDRTDAVVCRGMGCIHHCGGHRP